MYMKQAIQVINNVRYVLIQKHSGRGFDAYILYVDDVPKYAWGSCDSSCMRVLLGESTIAKEWSRLLDLKSTEEA